MTAFNVLPKKTLLLATFLGIILLFLIALQFTTRDSSQENQKNLLPTSTPLSKKTTLSQQKPSLKSSTTTSSDLKIEFNLPEGLRFPTTIETIAVEREIDEDFKKFLSSRLRFSINPKTIEDKLIFQTEDFKKTLIIDKKSGYVQYSNSTTDETRETNSKYQSIVIASDFIDSLNIVDIQPNTEILATYKKSLNELVPALSEKDTYYYEISYSQSYNSIPIYYQYNTPALITTLVDIYGEVRSFRFFNIKPVETINTTLLDIEQIKQKVSMGNYIVVKRLPAKETQLSGTLTLTSAKIAYIDDKLSSFLFPIMILDGKLSPSGDQVTLYVSILNN